MKREENNERFLVAKHYFEPTYGGIVKKGCKDGLFRVEYSIKKVWDNSIYHDDNGNFLDEPIHNFRNPITAKKAHQIVFQTHKKL